MDGPSRRLLKVRHHDMDNMEIKTKTLIATLYCEAIKFTVYKLQIRSNSGASGWTLTKRYSEFFHFRETLLQLFQKWDMELGDDSKRLRSREFALVTELVLPALEIPSFPRKHMRCDNEAIVAERRQKLQQFVRKMIHAYVEISVFMHNTQTTTTRSFDRLRQIFVRLENFLDVPQHQKDLDRRQTAAILALEDVEVIQSNDCNDRTCCICLNDYDSDDTNESSESFEERMVKLPCSHQFHEDCVIDWFNTSTTCPLCRKPAFVEEDVALNVTVN
ncbi:hypothetical protein BBJ28_00001324 [Nothophytophthora sp. Chile5]|nr:hypothetical protein BBJ28_00001324 [Nothophytophthora sp. Chile5]